MLHLWPIPDVAAYALLPSLYGCSLLLFTLIALVPLLDRYQYFFQVTLVASCSLDGPRAPEHRMGGEIEETVTTDLIDLRLRF